VSTVEALVWERDEGRCFRCGAPLRASWPGYSCHHRQPKGMGGGGGADTPENRIMLCGSGSSPHCHFWVHSHPQLARAEGWLVSRNGVLKPEEVPVRHWQRGMVLLDSQGGVREVGHQDPG
jgi:hypothetical protein